MYLSGNSKRKKGNQRECVREREREREREINRETDRQTEQHFNRTDAPSSMVLRTEKIFTKTATSPYLFGTPPVDSSCIPCTISVA
jgi:hypothetical protein